MFGLGISLRLLSKGLPTSSDIFWVSKGSIDAILKGLNPYGIAFPVYNNPQIHSIILAYLPFSILFEIPFQVLLGDLRYAIIFADVGIAILLYLIIKVKNEDIARAASGFYLLLTFPLNFGTPLIISEYRIFNGEPDPIWVFLILFAAYAYMKDKQFAAAILIGLSIATKQFAFLFFIPMFIMWMKKNDLGKRQYKPIIISLLTSIAIMLPFMFSSNGFISQTMFLMDQNYRPVFPAYFLNYHF
ncbi:MAG: glycosyltransferase 87 family protein [Nitrosotalea sp.]